MRVERERAINDRNNSRATLAQGYGSRCLPCSGTNQRSGCHRGAARITFLVLSFEGLWWSYPQRVPVIIGDIYFSSSILAQGSPLDDQDRQDADHEQYHLIVELEQHLNQLQN